MDLIYNNRVIEYIVEEEGLAMGVKYTDEWKVTLEAYKKEREEDGGSNNISSTE